MLPVAILTRLSDLLAARIGLNFPEERWADLERGISASAPALGAADALLCAHRLLSAPLTHREIEVLASRLTVGETYFFREKRAFEALEQHIFPALLSARRQDGRRLRIWSAGCCTGEEPYSIAMLLDRLIPDAASWNITLLATDINPESLRKAMRGEYGEWSFRDTPGWIRDRYFKPKRAGRFGIDEHIRKRVLFTCLNLADDIYPSLTSNTNAMDVIFCRNVLMYFTPGQARAVVDNLYRSLADGGWLIVSPVEASIALFSRFTAVEFDGVTLYRKCENAETPCGANPLPVPVADTGLEIWNSSAPLSPTAEAALPAPSVRVVEAHDSGTPASSEHDSSSMARDFANQGRLDEAAEWCHAAISADKLNPAHHYLLATIQQEQGLAEAAAQSLARALYLNPDFVLAHFALGNLHRLQGRRREAQRLYDTALTLLRAHPPDEVLAESDSLTAGRLGEIIESIRLSLQRRATDP